MIPLKPNLRTILRLAKKEREKLEALIDERVKFLFFITKGFDPFNMNQIPELREWFDNGFYEI